MKLRKFLSALLSLLMLLSAFAFGAVAEENNNVITLTEYTYFLFQHQEPVTFEFTPHISNYYCLKSNSYRVDITNIQIFNNPERTGDPIEVSSDFSTFNTDISGVFYLNANETVYITITPRLTSIQDMIQGGVTCGIKALLRCPHISQIVDENNDTICDLCGEKIIYDIYVGSSTEISFTISGHRWLRFNPEEDSYYHFSSTKYTSAPGKWFDQDMNEQIDGKAYGTGDVVPMKAGQNYYLSLDTEDEAFTAEMLKVCHHTVEFTDYDGDCLCDDCGEKTVYEITEGSTTEIPRSDFKDRWLRFIPEESGYFILQESKKYSGNWLDQNLNNLESVFDVVSMETGNVYYKNTYGDITAEMKRDCGHAFELTDHDGDCLCDNCGQQIVYPLSLGESTTLTIAPKTVIYAKATTTDAGYYIVGRDPWLNEDLETVATPDRINDYYVYADKETSYYFRLEGGYYEEESVDIGFRVCTHENKSSYTTNRIDPTCTSEGSYDSVTSCHTCPWRVTEHITTEKLPHTPGEWIIVSAATCSKEGEKEKRCTECNEVIETATIETKMHKPNGWQLKTSATCTSEGEEVLICTVCNEEFRSRAIEKLPHTDADSNGLCDVCGEETDVNPAPTPAGDDENKCKYCGQVHEGFFGKLIGFFHRILYFFAHLFGRK